MSNEEVKLFFKNAAHADLSINKKGESKAMVAQTLRFLSKATG